MSVFISYSHQDKDFVDWLAIRLVEENVVVWVDRWELRPGDSIVEKIQEAITDAACLCVVLSKRSVESEWCKKELNAGLIRELDEKRVVVIPLILDDCEMAAFLREKVYADFRTNREEGLEDLLKGLAGALNDSLGRVSGPEYVTDYALDWHVYEDAINLWIEAVSFSKNQEWCITTTVRIIGNDAATARYHQFAGAGFGEIAKQVPLEMCAELRKDKQARISIEPTKPAETNLVLEGV